MARARGNSLGPLSAAPISLSLSLGFREGGGTRATKPDRCTRDRSKCVCSVGWLVLREMRGVKERHLRLREWRGGG